MCVLLWNFTGVQGMVWRWTYYLKFNPQIIFVTFFTSWTYTFYDRIELMQGILCWKLLQFYADFFDTLQVLGHGLKMCMSFGFNPQNNFCHFLTSCTYPFLRSKWIGAIFFCVGNFYSFMPLKLYRWSDHVLKMCILFGFNTQITFCPK